MIKLIENYSDKGIAVIGDTYPLRAEFKALNGSFNNAVKYEGEKVKGWFFSKKKIEAIRDLVERHSAPAPLPSEPVTPVPIVEREIKAKFEPVKTIKLVKQVDKTGFKMLVKCTGFVELEREFTNEQVMNKFLTDLRKQREKDVDSKMGVLRKGSNRIHFSPWNSRPDQLEKAIADLKADMIKNGVEPLRIEFTNLK